MFGMAGACCCWGGSSQFQFVFLHISVQCCPALISRELSKEKINFPVREALWSMAKGRAGILHSNPSVPMCSYECCMCVCVCVRLTEQPLVILIHVFGWGLLLYRAAQMYSRSTALKELGPQGILMHPQCTAFS